MRQELWSISASSSLGGCYCCRSAVTSASPSQRCWEPHFGSPWSICLAGTCLSTPQQGCAGAAREPSRLGLPCSVLHPWGLCRALHPGCSNPSWCLGGEVYRRVVIAQVQCLSANLAVRRLVFMNRVDVIEQIVRCPAGTVVIACLNNLNFCFLSDILERNFKRNRHLQREGDPQKHMGAEARIQTLPRRRQE